MCALQQADVLFLSDMAKYMKNDPAAAVYPHATMSHLMWWSWNPNSGDTGGIVQDDWLTVSHLSLSLSSLDMNLSNTDVKAVNLSRARPQRCSLDSQPERARLAHVGRLPK